MSVLHFVPFALAPDADRFTGTPTTDRIRVPGAGKLVFAIVEGAGGTGTAAITAKSYAAATGGTGTALAFRYKTATSSAEIHNAGGWTTATTSGVTPAAGANKTTLVEFRFDELTADEPFVELIFTEGVDSPVDAAVIAVIIDGDRPGDDGVTYIA